MFVAYSNATVFTGERWLDQHVVLVKNGIIEDVLPIKQIPSDIKVIDCKNQLLVPSFIDLQIYGAAEKLFSVYPTVSSLQLLADHNAASGTAACLATIATQPIDVIHNCLDAIKEYQNKGGKGILGLHLEGPFINAEKRGAHVKEWIHSPTVAETRTLLDKADGAIKMVTLAPEILDKRIINIFNEYNIIVAIGHSNASFEEATKVMNNGVKTVTHLFNAMSPFHHRNPGLPGAVMQHATTTASIIPDGIHVHYETVKIAKQIMGERLFFITDAVTYTTTGPYQHQFNKNHYTMRDGTLSGSALTMVQAVHNAVHHCDIPLGEALRMASFYPARLMGLQKKIGKIEKGYTATCTLLEKDLSSAIVLYDPFESQKGE